MFISVPYKTAKLFWLTRRGGLRWLMATYRRNMAPLTRASSMIKATKLAFHSYHENPGPQVCDTGLHTELYWPGSARLT
jgi:hypothetical protein